MKTIITSKLCALVTHFFMAVSCVSLAQAQTQLRPPTPPGQAAATTTTTTTLKPASTVVNANLAVQNLKIGKDLIALHTLPDNQILKGASGKTITVARLKQLQALLDPTKPTAAMTARPVVKAQAGQNLASLAALPSNSRISLVKGQKQVIASPAQLSHIKSLIAKMNEPRTVQAVPRSMGNIQARHIVGAELSFADALKKPAAETIKIGNYTYTAEQLRLIDLKLRQSRVDPRGLVDRMNARSGNNTSSPRQPAIGK